MQVRGPRRRQSLDRGFVLSDHADWDGLLKSIEATGAENIWATHGYTAPLVRWLRERGKNAIAIKTHFESETGEEGEISQKQTKGTKSEETQGRIDSEKSSFSSSLSVDEVE
jgi:putative mRNA 3-end processing factor